MATADLLFPDPAALAAAGIPLAEALEKAIPASPCRFWALPPPSSALRR